MLSNHAHSGTVRLLASRGAAMAPRPRLFFTGGRHLPAMCSLGALHRLAVDVGFVYVGASA